MNSQIKGWPGVGTQVRPEEWLERVNRLDASHRAPVARIIWWDFFAHRMALNAWDHLNEFVNSPRIKVEGMSNLQEMPETWTDQDLRNGLINCGYPEIVAYRRVKTDTRKKTPENEPLP